MTKTYELDEIILSRSDELNARHLAATADVIFDSDGTPRSVELTAASEWTDDGNTETVLDLTDELEAELAPLFIIAAEGDDYAPTARDFSDEAREASQLHALDTERGK
jgi:acetyl esterase/lipase